MTVPLNEHPDWLINWFDDFEGPNKYRFLSNFYIGEPIRSPNPDLPMFMTGEHFFQACKAIRAKDFYKVVAAESPGESKRLGRKLMLRPDWEAVKFDIMATVLRMKFQEGRIEADWLVDTEDALLVEGNFWGDRVWGVDLKVMGYPGRNWLGTLLMARRAELRAGIGISNDHLVNMGLIAYEANVTNHAWQWQIDSRAKALED